jgi:hypothetical protein
MLRMWTCLVWCLSELVVCLKGLQGSHSRDICARFTLGSASHPRIRRKCCAHLLHEERATRDVTFGPLCSRLLNGIARLLMSWLTILIVLTGYSPQGTSGAEAMLVSTLEVLTGHWLMDFSVVFPILWRNKERRLASWRLYLSISRPPNTLSLFLVSIIFQNCSLIENDTESPDYAVTGWRKAHNCRQGGFEEEAGCDRTRMCTKLVVGNVAPLLNIQLAPEGTIAQNVMGPALPGANNDADTRRDMPQGDWPVFHPSWKKLHGRNVNYRRIVWSCHVAGGGPSCHVGYYSKGWETEKSMRFSLSTGV